MYLYILFVYWLTVDSGRLTLRQGGFADPHTTEKYPKLMYSGDQLERRGDNSGKYIKGKKLCRKWANRAIATKLPGEDNETFFFFFLIKMVLSETTIPISLLPKIPLKN